MATRKVSYEFALYAKEHYSASSLISKEPWAKIFNWEGKIWTCTGACTAFEERGSNLVSYLSFVDIYEVVPKEEYTGPKYEDKPKDSKYYLGLIFKSDNKEWVITDNEIELVPSKEEQLMGEEEEKPRLASLPLKEQTKFSDALEVYGWDELPEEDSFEWMISLLHWKIVYRKIEEYHWCHTIEQAKDWFIKNYGEQFIEINPDDIYVVRANWKEPQPEQMGLF